jgi:hypothetical protein
MLLRMNMNLILSVMIIMLLVKFGDILFGGKK